MSLQYLTNPYPPPAQSALEYDVEPGTVFLSTASEQLYVNLTITVTNTTSAPIDCLEFQFGFLAGAGTGNLTTVNEAASVTGISDQNEWTITSSGSFAPSGNQNLFLFTVTPSGISDYLPLAAGGSLVLHLKNILVDQSVGEGAAPITIIEQTGTSRRTSQRVQGAIDIEKAIGSLAITAFTPDPRVPISPGDSVELSWSLEGSDHWQVYDSNTATLLYDSIQSTPHKLMQWPVAPQTLTPRQNTTYELIAWAGQLYTAATADVMVMAATFTAEPTATPSTVSSPGVAVTLKWQTSFASSLTISAPGFDPVTFNAPAGQYDNFPGAPNNEYQVKPESTTTYTIQISGPGGSTDSRELTVSVQVPPLVSCSATPVAFAHGQTVNLSWETSNSDGGVYLSEYLPGQTNPTPVRVQQTETDYPVNPSALTVYELTADGQGESSATAWLAVVEMGAKLPISAITQPKHSVLDFLRQVLPPGFVTNALLAEIDQAAANVLVQPRLFFLEAGNLWGRVGFEPPVTFGNLSFDGLIFLAPANLSSGRAAPPSMLQSNSGVWAVNSLWYMLSILTRSLLVYAGQILGSYSLPFSGETLAFDGAYLWVANSTQMIKVNPADGSQTAVINTGCTLNGLVFDGTNMWACQPQSGQLVKLRASDGQVLNTFTVGTLLTAILFDGTYIWVADKPGQSIMKIQPSDGSVLATIKVGAAVGQFAFDGALLWMTNDDQAQVFGMRVSDQIMLCAIPTAPNTDPNFQLSIVTDGNNLWVADELSITRYVLKVASA